MNLQKGERKMNFSKDKVILITGGTGSFGKKFTEILFKKHKPKKVIIFSRDEYKQFEMSKVFPACKYPIRYFLGDIRDRYRLQRAFEGVDWVVHAAALKQVPALEYNPTEAVRTNVDGADNIVSAAIDSGVKKVVAISTDKAVNPINLYGATKLVAEKVFIAANAFGGGRVKFSVVRYGNVVGSRGSVIPLFLNLKKSGTRNFPLTDGRMTRFWITLEQGVNLVVKALKDLQGGEIFIPKIPSMRIIDLAKAIEPKCAIKIIGIRPGEKLHEVLISQDEARNTKELKDYYIIQPAFHWWNIKNHADSKKVPDDFVYSSELNKWWLSPNKLKEMVRKT